MILLFSDKKDCCGCGACAMICPHHAIRLQPDEYGFIYPVINPALCVECGACFKVCNFKVPDTDKPLEVYAAQGKSNKIDHSASGGIFATLASAVISEGGVAYGCALKQEESQLSPVITAAYVYADLEALKGSKYVQSMTGDTYKEVRDMLQNGVFVLYSGLPCQIAGLKGFLRKDYKNLLTIDIICHGTPNAKMFNNFVHTLEYPRNEVVRFNFRSKKYGWGKYVYAYTLRNIDSGKEDNFYRTAERSPYYRMFLEASIYRDSCYSCPFASSNRVSDISIGDCWGVECEHPEYDRAKDGLMSFARGVSCVLINTRKGQNFYEKHIEDFISYKVSFESVSLHNQQLNHPSVKHKNREKYLEAFKKNGYKGLVLCYYWHEWKNLLKEYISLCIPNRIKLYIRRYV